MTTNLEEVREVLRDFAGGRLTPGEFVERYMTIWRERIDAQDAAIARHAGMGDALAELRRHLGRGEISNDEYRAAVQAQYQRLEDVGIRPGSEVDRLLGHLFVQADAYVEETAGDDERGHYPREAKVSAEQLHEDVRLVLMALDAG